MTTPNQPHSEGFILVANSADVADGRMTSITLNNAPLILTRISGSVHAFSALCPHASSDLSQGELHRGRIDCPNHGYRFDIPSGHPVWPPDEACRLKKYPVKEEKGKVFVKL